MQKQENFSYVEMKRFLFQILSMEDFIPLYYFPFPRRNMYISCNGRNLKKFLCQNRTRDTRNRWKVLVQPKKKSREESQRAHNFLTRNKQKMKCKKNEKELFLFTYLPVYTCSWRKIAARTVTMTVPRGLNIAEKSGPFRAMHHACTKNEIPDPTTPCAHQRSQHID